MGLKKIIHNTWVVSMGQHFQSEVNVCWCPQQNWNPDFTLICLPMSTLSSISLVLWQDHLLLGGHCQRHSCEQLISQLCFSQQTKRLNLDVKKTICLIISSTEFWCMVQPAAQLHFTLWMRHASHDAREHSLLTFSLNLYCKILWEGTQWLTSEL